MATLELMAEKPPLRQDEDGVFRVGSTRVRLDTVIGAFHTGCLAEEIHLKYPSRAIKDIYAVIAYYLQHREEIDAYLIERRVQIEEAEREIETRFPSAGIREHLLPRRVLQIPSENLD